MSDTLIAPPRSSSRIRAIDVGRGIALVAMAIYHFTWDLEFFGYVEPGLTAVGGWKIFARCIASSFLFLVGVSLVLAHANGPRWKPFLIRLAQVAAAAGAISLATWLAVPGGFIFFGILHQIALGSLLGVLLLSLPAVVLIPIAGFVIAAPTFLRSDAFDTPWLWWVGLSSVNPHSNDYVPLFPWFGAILLGMAATKVATRLGLIERMRSWSIPRFARLLEWGGRHSLAVYLIHQPVLIALVWAATQIVPPAAPDPRVGFERACQAQCREVRDQAFCSSYCTCVMDDVERLPGGIAGLDSSVDNPARQSQLQDVAAMCSSEVDLQQLDGVAE
jgi:uncharacterized membrane protein